MQTAEGSAQREAIVAFKDLEFQYEAKMAYWNDILESVKLWQSVFTTLREEVRKISEARGWDVVVADDSSAEFFPSREAPSRPNTNSSCVTAAFCMPGNRLMRPPSFWIR